MHPRRRNLLIAGALIVATILLVVWSLLGRQPSEAVAPDVRGIVGTESASLFADPEIQAGLARHGLRVQTPATSGSLQMADLVRANTDPSSRYDFAMPSSTPGATRLEAERGIPPTDGISPFFSPMVIATWKPLLALLGRANLVHTDAQGNQVLDLAGLVDLIDKSTRWQDLGVSPLPATRGVLLSTTDPADSNSAAMFVAAASNAVNGGRAMTLADVPTVVARLCPVFQAEGSKDASSQILFDEYLRGGIGGVQMAFVYENQVKIAQQQNLIKSDMAFLYPDPSVYSTYTVVPLDDVGRQLGQALHDDPAIYRRAAALGFRPAEPTPDNPGNFLPLPGSVVDPPSYGSLTEALQDLAKGCS